MRRLPFAILAICLGVSAVWPRHLAAAQADFVPAAGTPPEVGSSILERPLTERGTVITRSCPSGLAAIEQATDGVLFEVRGGCSDSLPGASIASAIPGLLVPDGEIRLEIKIVNGAARAGFLLYTRMTTGDGLGFYSVVFAPAAGQVELVKVAGQSVTTVGRRSDLQSLFSSEDWNRVALRMDGPRL